MVHDRLDAVKVEFDDERAVCNAGVLLVATLAKRLGLEALVGEASAGHVFGRDARS